MIFDVPRITTSLRDSITPVNSSVIYNTDNNRYEYYNGTSWKPFGEGGVISFNTRTGEVTLLDSDIASLGDFTISGTVTVNNDIILGSQALKIITSSVDPNVSGVAGNIGSIVLKNDGSMWQKDGSSNTDWSQVQTGEYSNEPTGFPIDSTGEVDRTSSTISFVDGVTRTFSIAPTSGSYIILIKGRQYRKTTTESIQISNTEGLHYIYFDENGELQETTSFSLEFILKYVAVAIIYWNVSTSKAILFGDERHGCTMDAHTHARIHADSGTVYVSGSALSGFTIDGNGTSNTHTQFAITSGQVRDEDILHNLSSKSSTDSIPVLYRLGSDWYSVTNTNQKFHYVSGGRAYWNQNTGGTYSLTEITNNDFVLYHIVSTNDKNNPYFSIMGLNRYTTKNNAREGALTEISQYTGLPFVEFVFIATIIFQSSNTFTNTGKSIIVSTDTGGTYIDWRFSKTLNPSTVNVNIHNNLGGIYGGSPFYHSDQPITTTDSVTFHAINSSTTLDVSGTSTLTTTNMTTGNVSGALNVTGTSTLTTANITTGNVSGALNVTGTSTQTTINMTNGNISNALNVTGTSTLATTNMTIGNVSGALSVTGTSTQGTVNLTTGNVSGALNVTGTSTFTDVNLSGGLIIGGNLTVNGTTTTVNSTITTLEDPIIVLGKSSPSTDDNKDRGIAFNYHTGSSPKTGYFGYQDSTGKLIYVPDATITNEVVSGNKGILDAYLDWSNLTSIPDYLLKTGGTISGNLVINGDLTASTGTSTFKTVNITDNTGISGTLNVTGTSTLSTTNITTGNVSGALNVTGTSTQNTINFTTGNVSGALNVTGTSTLKNITASGTVIVNGLTYPSGDGTPNQVLKTDGSGNLSFGTITQDHSLLTNLQGGGGGNYYHSNQPINSTDNVSFNNLTVVSGVNVTGSVKLNNITYPISDGSNGQVMTTDGSGNISFTTVASGGTAASGSGTILDTYINSKTSEINNNSSSNIQTIFSQAISGIYTFWVSTDPRIKGTFYFNENDPSNSVLESISSSVSSKQDNAGTLNIYISSVNVIIQNKLGSNITLCIRRETTPLINPEPGNVSISNHNNLYGLQGGATNTYYHSNQPINTTDNVTFSGINVNGDITATGTISTTNSVTFGSISIPITTSNATGTINDVSTANIGGYRFTSSSVLTITGFANGINGELLYLHNASSVNIIIKNSSSSSLNDNRILTGNGSDLILKPDKSISLQYDSFSLRWRVLGGSGGNSGENPETLDLSNSPSTIDFSQYSTTSFRIKNPAQITLTSGTNGVWYTLAIVSDGNYSFTSETRFPLNNAQPVPSSGTVDLYTFHCIDTVSGTRYLATFAYDYSGVTLP